MDPLVSERLHLEWRPDGAVAERDEAEQVIVLQGRSGFFLDVRWGKGATPRLTRCTAGWKTIEAARPGEGAASKSCFKGGGCVVTPSYGSDWPSLLAEGRARFTPIFDSDRPDANGPSPDAEDVDAPDEGSFTTLPNGDVLEHGEMRRPETRIKTPYEELWRRLPLTADGGQPLILLLESVGDDGEKAFLGRVGEHQVGISRPSHGQPCQVVVRRLSSDRWKTVVDIAGGAAALPCLSTMPARPGDDRPLQLDGRSWRVIEQNS